MNKVGKNKSKTIQNLFSLMIVSCLLTADIEYEKKWKKGIHMN